MFQAKEMLLGMAQRLESAIVVSKRVTIPGWLSTQVTLGRSGNYDKKARL